MKDPEDPVPAAHGRSEPPPPSNGDRDGTAASAHRFHPAVIATAVALPVALIVGIIVAAVIVANTDADDPAETGPVAVSAAVAAPHSGSEACSTLMAALPDTLGDYTRAEVAEPAPEAVAAWRPPSGESRGDGSGPPGDPGAIIMRCGLERPPEFRQGARLDQVDAVQWFRVTDDTPDSDRATWFAVDRPVYVALTMPAGAGSGPIQEFSALLERLLPEQDIDPAPYREPGTPAPDGAGGGHGADDTPGAAEGD